MGEYRIRAVLAMTATAGTVTRIKQTSKGIINQSTNIEAEGCRERMAPCNRPLLLMCVCVCVCGSEGSPFGGYNGQRTNPRTHIWVDDGDPFRSREQLDKHTQAFGKPERFCCCLDSLAFV